MIHNRDVDEVHMKYFEIEQTYEFIRPGFLCSALIAMAGFLQT
jgi:hypothetical protein